MRPEVLHGETHKLKFTQPDGKNISFYVTVNLHEVDGKRKPWEVFVNVRDASLWEHLVAVTIGVSRLLQAGVDVRSIAQDLTQIHSPVTGHNSKEGWAPSLYFRIGTILEGYA